MGRIIIRISGNMSSRPSGGCQENSGDPNAFPGNPRRPVPTERFPSLRPPRKPLHTRTPYLEPPEIRINIAPGDARNVHVCRHAFSTRRDLAAGCRCDFLNFGVWVKEIKLFDLRFGILVKSCVYFTPGTCSLNLRFPVVFGGPGRFKKLREACRNNFHPFSPGSELVVPHMSTGKIGKHIRVRNCTYCTT